MLKRKSCTLASHILKAKLNNIDPQSMLHLIYSLSKENDK